MSDWIRWALIKLKRWIDPQPQGPMDRLMENHRKLEEKLKAYKNKAYQEAKKREKFEKVGNREVVSQCLELERRCEQLFKKFENFQFHINKLIIKLEEVKAAAETVEVMRIGQAELQKLQRVLNIDVGNEVMNEINALIASFGLQDSSPTTFGDSNEAERAV